MGRGCLAPGRRKKKKKKSCRTRQLLSPCGSEVSWPLPASGRPPGSRDQWWEDWAHAGQSLCWAPPPCRIQPRSLRSLQCAPDTTPYSRLTRFSGVLRSPITSILIHELRSEALVRVCSHLSPRLHRWRRNFSNLCLVRKPKTFPTHFLLPGVVSARENQQRTNFLPRTEKTPL